MTHSIIVRSNNLDSGFSFKRSNRLWCCLIQVGAVPMEFPHVVLDEGMSRTITFGGMRLNFQNRKPLCYDSNINKYSGPK